MLALPDEDGRGVLANVVEIREGEMRPIDGICPYCNRKGSGEYVCEFDGEYAADFSEPCSRNHWQGCSHFRGEEERVRVLASLFMGGVFVGGFLVWMILRFA
jgi:hypothetical protein